MKVSRYRLANGYRVRRHAWRGTSRLFRLSRIQKREWCDWIEVPGIVTGGRPEEHPSSQADMVFRIVHTQPAYRSPEAKEAS